MRRRDHGQGFPQPEDGIPAAGSEGLPALSSQLAGLEHLERIALEQAAAGMASTLSLEVLHEQLSDPARRDLPRVGWGNCGASGDGAAAVPAREVPRGALSKTYDIPSVEFRRRHAWLCASLAALAALAGLARHAWYAAVIPAERPVQILWAAGFAWMGMQWALSWLDRPRKVTEMQQHELDRLQVTVNIPLYNEDPAITDRVLYALACQSRPADRIEVIDDGSSVDYSAVRITGSSGSRWRGSGRRTAERSTRR